MHKNRRTAVRDFCGRIPEDVIEIARQGAELREQLKYTLSDYECERIQILLEENETELLKKAFHHLHS